MTKDMKFTRRDFLVGSGAIIAAGTLGLAFSCKNEILSSTEVVSSTDNSIVIAVVTSLGSIEGADALRCVQMAADEINSRGGVSIEGEKCTFKVVSIDTRESEPGIPVSDALAALEKIILEKKPCAIVAGAFRSEVLLASMDVIAKYKVPYIATIAMTPEYQDDIVRYYTKYKYCFRTGFNSAYLTIYLSDVMGYLRKQFGLSEAFIVAQDVLWAKSAASGVEVMLRAQGWEILGMDAYPTGASDFSASLIKAKDRKTQVIIPIFDMPQAGILLKQTRSMNVPAILCGFISPVAQENAWSVFEGQVDGMINFVYEVGPIPVTAVPKSIDFNEAYGKKYGEDKRIQISGHGPAPSYDAVYVLADAIQRADTLDGDALVTALEGTDVRGVIGRIKFGEIKIRPGFESILEQNHQVTYGSDPNETAIGCAFQWRNGKRVIVYPPVLAQDNKIELPSYVK